MAIITLSVLKTHLLIADDDTRYDALFTEYIRFSERKAYEIVRGTEGELILDFTEAVKSISGFSLLSVTVPEKIGATAYTDTFKGWLNWVETNVLPLLTTAQYAEIAWYYAMFEAMQDACIMLCRSAAMEDGILGKDAIFRVGSISTSTAQQTINTVYKSVEPIVGEVLRQYRRYRVG